MRAYFIVIACLGAMIGGLMLPDLLMGLTYLTFGLVLLFGLLIANLFALMILMIPAVLLGRKTRAGAALLGAVIFLGAVFGPGLYRNHLDPNAAWLQPVLSAELKTPPRSVELWTKWSGKEAHDLTCSDICMQLLRNPDLDWIRLRWSSKTAALFARDRDGRLRAQENHERPADVMINDYEVSGEWPRPGNLDIWEVQSRPEGYVIVDQRNRKVIARNLEAKAKGVWHFAFLYMDPEERGLASLHLWRNSWLKISADPDRTLKSDLIHFGLFDPDISYDTVNDPVILDDAVRKILQRYQSPHPAPLSADEKDLLREFDLQLDRGLRLPERKDLVAELIKQGFGFGKGARKILEADPSIRSELFAIAASNFHNRDIFAAKLAKLEFYYRLDRNESLAEVGQYETEIAMAFRRADHQRKVNSLPLLYYFKMDHPDLILDQIIALFPPLSDVNRRYSDETLRGWQAQGADIEFMQGLWKKKIIIETPPDHIQLSHPAIIAMAKMEDLDQDYLRSWMMRWSLEHHRVRWFEKDVNKAVVDLLVKHDLLDVLAFLQGSMFPNRGLDTPRDPSKFATPLVLR